MTYYIIYAVFAHLDQCRTLGWNCAGCFLFRTGGEGAGPVQIQWFSHKGSPYLSDPLSLNMLIVFTSGVSNGSILFQN